MGETPTAERSEAEERWWKLLRRGFRIPDIVSDQNREAAIAHALRHGLFESLAGSVDDAKAVVATVVRMGGEGRLDELFMLGTDRAHRKTLVDGVTRELLSGGRVEGPSADDRPDRFDALVETVFDRITRHVADHPYEN